MAKLWFAQFNQIFQIHIHQVNFAEQSKMNGEHSKPTSADSIFAYAASWNTMRNLQACAVNNDLFRDMCKDCCDKDPTDCCAKCQERWLKIDENRKRVQFSYEK